MTRASRLAPSLAVAALLWVVPALGAQSVPNINAPKQAAQRTADAANARVSAQTGQAVPAPRSGPPATAGSAPSSASRTLARPVAAGEPGRAGGEAADTAPAGVTREVYSYSPASRRDPFFSLILTEDLRPLLTDLRLVGILYAAAGGRSVAIMRDLQTNQQYRVNTGTTLGRLRVAQIRPRAVIFSIDEFGLSRQDSLVLTDSTQVRNR